jgi:hypothetical protein
MLKRNWALIALVYLAFAEALSWVPVPDLSPCLIQPEDREQPTSDGDKKYCPAFHTGAAVVFENVDSFLEHHDKSVVGGFTIVLAISTIGLWLATNKLWEAGEKQFGLLSESAAAQSRDMQESIGVAKQSADAAILSARAAISIHLPIIRIEPNPLGWGDNTIGGTIRAYCNVHAVTFVNRGATKTFPIELRYGFTVGGQLPPEPHYQFADRFLPNVIFEPDPRKSEVKNLSGDAAIETTDWPLICTGAKEVWFYCVLTFEDFMETRHDASFCWQWKSTGSGMAWRPDRTPTYNRKT